MVFPRPNHFARPIYVGAPEKTIGRCPFAIYHLSVGPSRARFVFKIEAGRTTGNE
jgi:hypothetical protein